MCVSLLFVDNGIFIYLLPLFLGCFRKVSIIEKDGTSDYNYQDDNKKKMDGWTIVGKM